MLTADGHPVIDYKKLRQRLANAKSDTALFQAITDAPFEQKVETNFLFLGIVVLLLVNKEENMIDRIALSNTDFAELTTDVSVVPFEQIRIPLGVEGNIIAEAIKTGNPQDTTDWRFLFHPALNPQQARINQANAGIAYSAVHPLDARDGGAMIFSYFQYEQGIGDEQRDFMSRYVQLAAQSLS